MSHQRRFAFGRWRLVWTLPPLIFFCSVFGVGAQPPPNPGPPGGNGPPGLNVALSRVLRNAGFTGNIEAMLEARLGRSVDPELAELGRLLFFDKILGLHNDNSCAGCHAPAFGFGDSQPMAIGVDNNDVVGANRRGPRNQRRSPLVGNTIFYPALMWTPRFVAVSGDPFNPFLGFRFPARKHHQRGADAAGRARFAAFHGDRGDGRVLRDPSKPGAVRATAFSEIRRRTRRRPLPTGR